MSARASAEEPALLFPRRHAGHVVRPEEEGVGADSNRVSFTLPAQNHLLSEIVISLAGRGEWILIAQIVVLVEIFGVAFHDPIALQSVGWGHASEGQRRDQEGEDGDGASFKHGTETVILLALVKY